MIRINDIQISLGVDTWGAAVSSSQIRDADLVEEIIAFLLFRNEGHAFGSSSKCAGLAGPAEPRFQLGTAALLAGDGPRSPGPLAARAGAGARHPQFRQYRDR